MARISQLNLSKLITESAIKGIQNVKGQDIAVMDLLEVGNSVCDYFVICHGSSNTNVEAIANSVEDEVREALSEKPLHREGLNNAEWVLLDYFSVVIHIFQKEKRDFYNIEELWADAKIERIPEEN